MRGIKFHLVAMCRRFALTRRSISLCVLTRITDDICACVCARVCTRDGVADRKGGGGRVSVKLTANTLCIHELTKKKKN